jgi:RES domain
MKAPSRGISIQAPDPDQSLSSFPAVTLRTNQHFYRCTRTANGPWWFSSSGGGRFDLRSPRGTCYLATDATTAVREALGPIDGSRVVTRQWFEDRSVRRLRLPRPTRVANTYAETASSHGVTLEISTIVPYDIPQTWAVALDQAGYGGVTYLLRHSAAPRRGIALFGATGERTSWRRGIARPLDDSMIRSLERAFGITIADRPSSRSLTFLDPH